MEPFDALTEEDKKIIFKYIQTYANATPCDLKQVLEQWNKNKRTLFKAFGKQLRVVIPFEYSLEDYVIRQKLSQIYCTVNRPYYIRDKHNETSTELCIDCAYNPFLDDVFHYFLDMINIYKYCGFEDLDNFRKLFRYKTIQQGIVDVSYTFHCTDDKLAIVSGTKIMKAIQKILKFYKYPNMNLFEDFRNAISNITSLTKVTQNLVLSIHPIDYMTMSDNNCDWHSCMNWMSNGGYSTGTIEMLNSNMVVVAYLESDKKFYPFAKIDGYQDLTVPNKSWRVLLYVHKQIIATGKQYPNRRDIAAMAAMTNMRLLVEKNLKWKYQYIDQDYNDLIHIYSNENFSYNKGCNRNPNARNCYNKLRHSIYIYTNVMYNDLIEDHDYGYVCCRNYVEKSLALNASGPMTCMCCGKIVPRREARDQDSSVKICPDCYKYHTCRTCNRTDINERTYMVPVGDSGRLRRHCMHCIMNNFYYNPNNQHFYDFNDVRYDYYPLYIEHEDILDEFVLYAKQAGIVGAEHWFGVPSLNRETDFVEKFAIDNQSWIGWITNVNYRDLVSKGVVKIDQVIEIEGSSFLYSTISEDNYKKYKDRFGNFISTKSMKEGEVDELLDTLRDQRLQS